jgi:hypothetical protein
MNEEEAEQLSILLMQIVAKLDQSAAFVKDKDSKEEWDAYRQAVGRAMAEICLELEEPLWKRFPNLKPEYLDGPYKVSPEIYEPRFYDGNETTS